MDGALCLAPSFLGTLDPACPHCALPFGASAELPLEEWVSWVPLLVLKAQPGQAASEAWAVTLVESGSQHPQGEERQANNGRRSGASSSPAFLMMYSA